MYDSELWAKIEVLENVFFPLPKNLIKNKEEI